MAGYNISVMHDIACPSGMIRGFPRDIIGPTGVDLSTGPKMSGRHWAQKGASPYRPYKSDENSGPEEEIFTGAQNPEGKMGPRNNALLTGPKNVGNDWAHR